MYVNRILELEILDQVHHAGFTFGIDVDEKSGAISLDFSGFSDNFAKIAGLVLQRFAAALNPEVQDENIMGQTRAPMMADLLERAQKVRCLIAREQSNTSLIGDILHDLVHENYSDSESACTYLTSMVEECSAARYADQERQDWEDASYEV